MLFGIRWRSMRAKIIAWSFVPTTIILVAVALVTFTAYQQVTEDLVIERNQELTRLSAVELASRLRDYSDLLKEYTALVAQSARTAFMYENDPAVVREILRRARSRLWVFDGGVIAANSRGKVVTAEPVRPDAIGEDWSNRAYFRKMLRSPEPVVSNIEADGPQSMDVIVVAVPIKGDLDQFLGIMAGMFHLGPTSINPFYGDIAKLRMGAGGNAYLVDGDGRVIFHSDPERIGDNLSSQHIVDRVLAGEVGALRTRDLDENEIVASFAPVPGTSWGLVTEESWRELINPSLGYQRFLLLLLVLGVVIPTMVVGVGVRRITKPITDLIRAAQELAGGNFGQTIEAPTGDEVEELAEQFNLMAGQLQASYAELERGVSERSKQLAALNAIAAVVSLAPDLQEILKTALDQTLDVIEIEAGGIYLLHEDGDYLTLAVYRGLSPEFADEIDRLEVGEGFSGRVVQTGEPQVATDISVDPRLTRMAARKEGLRSLASVPLSSKRRVLGTFFAVTHGYREFSDAEFQLLTSIGQQIGVAIETARLLEAERQRRREATLLAEMARLTSSTLNLDEVLSLTAEYAVDVFDVHCCCIFLYDEYKGTLRPAVHRGFDHSAAASIAEVDFRPSEETRKTVFEGLQPLIVKDVSATPHLSPEELLDLQSALVVPIEVGGRRLGIMQLGTRRNKCRVFTDHEGELALAMANQAAMAIESARLFKAEQRRAEQLRVINEMGRHITSILSVDDLLHQIVHLVKETLGYYQVGIGLIEGDNLVFRSGAGVFWEGPAFQPQRVAVGKQGITGWAAQTGEPFLVPDVTQEPRYCRLPGDYTTKSELAVPLKTEEGVIGVLNCSNDHPNGFDESDVALLQSLASQAAVAIEKARLYEQAQQVAALEERSRLARDLHDAVSQTLFSASLIAEAMPAVWKSDQQEGQELLQELRLLNRGALAEMRTLLMELRPSALAEASLGDLLRQLGEAVTGRTGMPARVAVEGRCDLPTDVHVALYRIAQEALNNVVKHAHAKHVEVRLRCVPPAPDIGECTEMVSVLVKDDGRGFDPSAISPDRLGLRILRERAQAIGAKLTIDSQRGRGTVVEVLWVGEDGLAVVDEGPAMAMALSDDGHSTTGASRVVDGRYENHMGSDGAEADGKSQHDV
jgi:nitrate/nitrite-specific signal transduction histidine kinase